MRDDRTSLEAARLRGLTVGTVMRETLETTLTFVAWYLEQGVDHIVICFDDPRDPAIDVLADHAQVHCIPCGAGFWRGIGVRAHARFPKRQNRAMQFVYESLGAGWFMTLDGDELVHLDGRTLSGELKATPDDVRSVTVLPVENIQGPPAPNQFHFRLPMTPAAVEQVYGDLAGMMQRRMGLSGHTIGKTASRVGITGANMRQHFLQQRADGEVIMDRVIGPEEGAYLLHFFDQDEDIWSAKLPWRLSSSGFTPRAKGVLSAALEGPDAQAALAEIYRHLHVFDAARIDELRALDAYYTATIDFAAVRQHALPGTEQLLHSEADWQPVYVSWI